MSLTIKNYCATGVINTNNGQPVAEEVMILRGATNGTVVKSLELTTGNESSYIYIIRKDSNDVIYSTIKIKMQSNDYLVLWEGFFVIPYNHTLFLKSDSNQTVAVANVIEM